MLSDPQLRQDDQLPDDEVSFWNNKAVRQILLRKRCDHHSWRHAHSCFKKGNECRNFLPACMCPSTQLFVDDRNPLEDVILHQLDGTEKAESRFCLQLQRGHGCQYMNTHSKPISEITGSNTNVQTGKCLV